MEIKNFSSGRLKNNAHFEFNNELVNIINKEGADKLNITEAFAEYAPLVQKEGDNLEVIKQSEITKELAKSGELRDEIFRGISTNVKSLTIHFDPNIRESAEKIKMVLKSFGNVAILSYNEETAAIESLTEELTGKYAADIKQCGLGAWTNKLQQQNEQFRQLMAQRNEAIAVKEPVHMRSLRKEIDKVYNKIVKRVNASALLNGTEQYGNFIALLNNRIEYYKTYNL